MKKFLLLAVAVAVVLFILNGKKKPAVSYVPSPNQAGTSTLRALAAARGIKIGAAMNDFMITGDANYAKIAKTEFSALTPENQMKWEYIEPARDQYNFTPADNLVAFAKENNMAVRGHALVHADGQLPSWLLKGGFSGDELKTIMLDHVKTVVAHYKNNFPGVVTTWDVVNESFNDDGSWRTGDMIWAKIGPSKEEYVRAAFKAAREAEPNTNVKLFYNDNGIETINPKSDATYNFIKSLKEQGAPIDGIGFQSHFINTATAKPYLDRDLSTLEANFKRFSELGLQIHITELDVPLAKGDAGDPAKLAAQAAIYKTMLATCLKFKNCTMFMTWGFTDKYSWIDYLPNMTAALLFDKNFAKKPAYYALYDTLKSK
jgi:endo-1,4-beta-xylanase